MRILNETKHLEMLRGYDCHTSCCNSLTLGIIAIIVCKEIDSLRPICLEKLCEFLSKRIMRISNA